PDRLAFWWRRPRTALKLQGSVKMPRRSGPPSSPRSREIDQPGRQSAGYVSDVSFSCQIGPYMPNHKEWYEHKSNRASNPAIPSARKSHNFSGGVPNIFAISLRMILRSNASELPHGRWYATCA